MTVVLEAPGAPPTGLSRSQPRPSSGGDCRRLSPAHQRRPHSLGLVCPLGFRCGELVSASRVGKTVLTFRFASFLLLFDVRIIFKIGLFWGELA